MRSFSSQNTKGGGNIYFFSSGVPHFISIMKLESFIHVVFELGIFACGWYCKHRCQPSVPKNYGDY